MHSLIEYWHYNSDFRFLDNQIRLNLTNTWHLDKLTNMHTIELIKTVVLQINFCVCINILIQLVQVNWCLIHRCIVNVLHFVDSDDGHGRRIQAQTVWVILGKHVHFDRLVALVLKSIWFQNFVDRRYFLYYFIKLICTVNTPTKVKWVIPVKFCF